MAYNFIRCDREQKLLLPPDMRDWLPKKHLAWFIIDIVSNMDLTPFNRVYNADGIGRSAYEPSMMAALYLYSYCTGERSSRKIERNCIESVPFRVISGDLQPDHSTINRFRKKFEKELGKLFIQVLGFCIEAGLCDLGAISIDGTKIKANASMSANRTESALKKDIEKYLREAEEIDAMEDEMYGPDKRGDELPPEMATREVRLKKLREFKERLEKERLQEVEEQRAKIEERKDDEKSSGVKKRGRKLMSVEKVEEKALEKNKVNLSDSESRIMKTGREGYLQGYNAQTSVSQDQIVVEASLTQECNDRKQLIPMLKKTMENLRTVKSDEKLEAGAFLADAGYYSVNNLKNPLLEELDVLVAVSNEYKTARDRREGKVIPLPLNPTSTMEYRLMTQEGRAMYSKRKVTVEPVFGQIKEVLGFRRFMRRGLSACESEWKMICTAHNLLKLWRYGIDKVLRETETAAAILKNSSATMVSAA